ncbi:MAG: T9SS type A sorting domain-containing protein [Lentimicrobiaceae bacterium]|nr:T9SS type A sorting domain-containing protein [Lentimicrobiaceae bacterium]
MNTILIFKKTNFKYFISILFFIFHSSFLIAQLSWPPAGMNGNGTSGNPWQITDSSHLRILADFVNAGNYSSTIGKYYILMNDIDLSGYANWTPIGFWDKVVYPSPPATLFGGNFDGNDKTVQNLTIYRPLEDAVGLFGYTSAVIKDLGVVNCNVFGKEYVGGLVGVGSGSSISNCYVIGNISGGMGYCIGGLVGAFGNSYHDIINGCYFIGNVNAPYSALVGGLIGYVVYSTISNCYAVGNVSGKQNVGGLIGQSMGGVSQEPYNHACIISNCYTAGNVQGESVVGGLVGSVGSDYNMVIRNCFAANDSVIGTNSILYPNSVNRIAGYIGAVVGVTFQNNYALNTMVVQHQGGNVPIIDSLNGRTGMGVPMDSLKSFSFYSTFNNWYQAPWSIQNPLGIWKICDGQDLPFLRWQGFVCNYDITATANINGAIIPNGTLNIADTSSQTFIFTPNTCYKIDSLWIDGVYEPDSIAAGSYTFNNVAKNHTIEVSFKRLPPDTVIICDTICYGTDYAQNGFNIINAITDSIYFNNDFNTNGCDSVTRLELTVNPLIITQISDSICEGDFYDFHGDSLTASGVYYDTLPAISGCDSVIELILTVISIDTTKISVEICEGDSCDFFGRQLTEKGIYYETLQTIHGCDSIIELTLTITKVGIATITNHELRIYPNPTDGKLIIESGELKIETIEIFDITGQVIKTYNSLTDNTIDISELPNAIYFITFHSEGQKIIRKLVKY